MRDGAWLAHGGGSAQLQAAASGSVAVTAAGAPRSSTQRGAAHLDGHGARAPQRRALLHGRHAAAAAAAARAAGLALLRAAEWRHVCPESLHRCCSSAELPSARGARPISTRSSPDGAVAGCRRNLMISKVCH